MREANMSAPQLLGAAGLIVTAVAIHAGWQPSPPQQLPADWHERFRAAALQIPFDSNRVPIPDSGLPRGAYPKGAPKMTIAGVKTIDTGQVGRVVLRITSDSAYPRLGIASGVNYVWQDFKNGKPRQFVIPADTGLPERSLVVTVHYHPKVPKWPRLRVVERQAPGTAMRPGEQPQTVYALTLCVRCSRPGGWCTSGDTTRSRVMIDLATLESIKAYFARNKVVWASR